MEQDCSSNGYSSFYSLGVSQGASGSCTCTFLRLDPLPLEEFPQLAEKLGYSARLGPIQKWSIVQGDQKIVGTNRRVSGQRPRRIPREGAVLGDEVSKIEPFFEGIEDGEEHYLPLDQPRGVLQEYLIRISHDDPLALYVMRVRQYKGHPPCDGLPPDEDMIAQDFMIFYDEMLDQD